MIMPSLLETYILTHYKQRKVRLTTGLFHIGKGLEPNLPIQMDEDVKKRRVKRLDKTSQMYVVRMGQYANCNLIIIMHGYHVSSSSSCHLFSLHNNSPHLMKHKSKQDTYKINPNILNLRASTGEKLDALV